MTTSEENQLTGSIPTEIGMLTKLTELALGKWLYCLDFLVCLLLLCMRCESTNLFSMCILMTTAEHHDLTGSIPTEIGELTELTFLVFGKWLHCLDFLVYLLLLCMSCESTNRFSFLVLMATSEENQLTGSIPTEIGRMTALKVLSLGKWLYCLDFLVYLLLLCRRCESTNHVSLSVW